MDALAWKFLGYLTAIEHQEREQARSYLSLCPVSTLDVFLEIFFWRSSGLFWQWSFETCTWTFVACQSKFLNFHWSWPSEPAPPQPRAGFIFLRHIYIHALLIHLSFMRHYTGNYLFYNCHPCKIHNGIVFCIHLHIPPPPATPSIVLDTQWRLAG